MTRHVQKALDDAQEQLLALYGGRLLRTVLFGSQARGDARADSDVDVLVVLRGPVHDYHELKRLVRVELKLFDTYGLNFSFLPYDEQAYQDLRRPLMQSVHEDGLEL